VVKKLDDARDLLENGRADPSAVLPAIAELATSKVWQTREVAATLLVELSKRHPEVIAAACLEWAASNDEFLRRAAAEGLRGLASRRPELVWPVLELLRADDVLYVRKAVANVLRNASSKQPHEVLALAERWSRPPVASTYWILREGLRKLGPEHRGAVEAILHEAATDKR
jgi:3-methyladenine DNA glycosylase AlkC